jgi:hypothetical protein
MKIEQYMSDPRYYKVLKDMEMLAIEDVRTLRQEKNGTIVWKLPIKCSVNRFIEVASFKTGYVRNQNSGHTNYQLNKRCEGEPEYFKLNNGDYRMFTTRGCVLIPVEIDRLEYLIRYCLKNYYIKHANYVANGNYIAKWEHEWKMKGSNTDRVKELQSENSKLFKLLENYKELEIEKTYYSPREVIVTVDGHRYNVI